MEQENKEEEVSDNQDMSDEEGIDEAEEREDEDEEDRKTSHSLLKLSRPAINSYFTWSLSAVKQSTKASCTCQSKKVRAAY